LEGVSENQHIFYSDIHTADFDLFQLRTFPTSNFSNFEHTECNKNKHTECNKNKHTECNKNKHTECNKNKHTECNKNKHTECNKKQTYNLMIFSQNDNFVPKFVKI